MNHSTRTHGTGTDGAIAAFGHDLRRLRPNILIGGVPGMAEREWPGGCLQIGRVRIGIQDLRDRCIMTSFDWRFATHFDQLSAGPVDLIASN